MDTRKSDGRDLRLRVSEWPRVSAWVPPGLALALLATLATLIQSIGIMLAVWGATVSLVLAALVARRAYTSRGRGLPGATTVNAVPAETVLTGPAPADTGSTGTRAPTADDQAAAASAPHTASGTAVSPGGTARPSVVTGQTAAATTYPLVASGLIMPELLVLTAEEVASVLRVDLDLVITSISNGELPGNRIGSHWRIDQRALVQWLQGAYGDTLLLGAQSLTMRAPVQRTGPACHPCLSGRVPC
jgi:excisionase family DNA binding protein